VLKEPPNDNKPPSAASAIAALKSLQREHAASKLMEPGHKAMVVVYSSQDGMSLQVGEQVRAPPAMPFDVLGFQV
jgi:hypothetical protein